MRRRRRRIRRRTEEEEEEQDRSDTLCRDGTLRRYHTFGGGMFDLSIIYCYYHCCIFAIVLLGRYFRDRLPSRQYHPAFDDDDDDDDDVHDDNDAVMEVRGVLFFGRVVVVMRSLRTRYSAVIRTTITTTTMTTTQSTCPRQGHSHTDDDVGKYGQSPLPSSLLAPPPPVRRHHNNSNSNSGDTGTEPNGTVEFQTEPNGTIK